MIPIDIKYPNSARKKELEIMSKDNQRILFNYLKEIFSFKNLGIEICLCSGLRIGELCALKWEDIDIENKLIKVRHTLQRIYYIEDEKRYTFVKENTPKTKDSYRDIPIANELLQNF